jgi:AraC-like DNA-binding protein
VLIINFGAPLAVAGPDGDATVHRGSFVARLSELPATTEFTGTSAGVQVDFTPLGLHLFCGLAVHELPEPAANLEDLLGEEGRRLTELLEAARDWESRFDLLDLAIARRVAATRQPSPSIQWAWQTLVASAGAVPIARLSDRLGCSRRYLSAGFRELAGVPPKTAARILRFERAAGLARAADRPSLARIAAECGYHDQAHMTREFRALAGITPSAYRAAALPGYLGLPAGACAEVEEVTFVQDGVAVPA